MLTKEQYVAYSNFTRNFFNTNFIYLNENLKGYDYIDRSTIPSAISKNYDLVLLGGFFYQCNIGELSEIKTQFNIYFSVLSLWNNDGYIIIGPYLHSPIKCCDIDNILKVNKLSPTLKEKLFNYYNTLPILHGENLHFFLNTLCQSIYGRFLENKNISSYDLPSTIIFPSTVFEAQALQKRADAIEERYMAERKFLANISKGDFESAKEILKIPQTLDRIPNKLRNEKNLLIVLNTLMRKTIESTNLHPIYIDDISGKWAVKIEEINNLQDIETCRKAMIYDYCHLVKTKGITNSYSLNVRKTIDYVHLNLSSHIALEDIAKRLQVNPSYLSQQFNKEVGKSLPEYVTEQRIQQAKFLLKEHYLLSVSKIATTVGFSDITYFARVFKNKTGLTPREYRNQSLMNNIV